MVQKLSGENETCLGDGNAELPCHVVNALYVTESDWSDAQSRAVCEGVRRRVVVERHVLEDLALVCHVGRVDPQTLPPTLVIRICKVHGEWGTWDGMRRVGCGVWDVECGMRCGEACGMRSVGWGVWWGVWDVECGMWRVGWGVWGEECGMRSVGWGVCVCYEEQWQWGLGQCCRYVWMMVMVGWCSFNFLKLPCTPWRRMRARASQEREDVHCPLSKGMKCKKKKERKKERKKG